MRITWTAVIVLVLAQKLLPASVTTGNTPLQ